jgi:hypothetical protein
VLPSENPTKRVQRSEPSAQIVTNLLQLTYLLL